MVQAGGFSITVVSAFDPAALVVLGGVSAYAYKHWLHDRNRDWMVFLTAILVGAFWIQAVAANLLGVTPWFMAPTARVSFPIGVFYVLSYPLWFRWSARAVFLLIGRTPREGGLLWVFTVRDRTEEFEPAWKEDPRGEE